MCQVTFRGENGSDAGGVFREGMSRVVEDLFSDTLNLLIPCPNALHGLPNNVDKYIPNPKLACCPLGLEMFEFVGKMMGMSMRANLCLPFQFPSLVWRRLLGQELSVKDMEAVDTLTCKLLDSVRSCRDPEDFDEKYGYSLTFVCTGWDGCVCMRRDTVWSAYGRDRGVTGGKEEPDSSSPQALEPAP